MVSEPKRFDGQRFNNNEQRRLEEEWSKIIFHLEGTKMDKISIKEDIIEINKYFKVPRVNAPMW